MMFFKKKKEIGSPKDQIKELIKLGKEKDKRIAELEKEINVIKKRQEHFGDFFKKFFT